MHAHDVRTCMDTAKFAKTGNKIYVFERDEYIANLLHMLLTREGFQVSAITNQDQIQETIETKTPPALMFLDSDWLHDDSQPILEFINQEATWRNTPVVLLLACHDAELIERFLNHGISDYLLQPFEPGQLLNVIQRNLY